MATAIEKDLLNEGPKAWLGYFAKPPAFFMASGGKLVFSDNNQAEDFIRDTLAKSIRKIQLKWTNIRVDSLTPDMATAGANGSVNGYFTAVVQHTTRGWQLRNAHWSIEHEGLP